MLRYCAVLLSFFRNIFPFWFSQSYIPFFAILVHFVLFYKCFRNIFFCIFAIAIAFFSSPELNAQLNNCHYLG